MLAEGNSLRATSRMSDVSFNTVVKLMLDVAGACEKYQDETLYRHEPIAPQSEVLPDRS